MGELNVSIIWWARSCAIPPPCLAFNKNLPMPSLVMFAVCSSLQMVAASLFLAAGRRTTRTRSGGRPSRRRTRRRRQDEDTTNCDDDDGGRRNRNSSETKTATTTPPLLPPPLALGPRNSDLIISHFAPRTQLEATTTSLLSCGWRWR